ncbi:hypothetical protein INS49_005433 [Diaporthe citri]|uniref:uncharacterized protein n=1 Tax=Diaporthe citri TaxID=83186 RepID=UPI001C800D5B|nr:uncharacterized protein INS49_005433 [Diaporthe citri]KAG6353724.1 hypothetical protein INS49_005433 [Diaporthe citri]
MSAPGAEDGADPNAPLTAEPAGGRVWQACLACRRKKIKCDGKQPYLKNHTFRPVTDDIFVHSGMIEYLQSKEFADEFKIRGYKILIGEVHNEETLYSSYNAPTEPTVDALKLQVSNYYAPQGNIVSDGQVRAPSRAFAKALVDNGLDLQDVWRYHIAYRLSFIDAEVAPASFSIAHAMDKPTGRNIRVLRRKKELTLAPPNSFAICHGPTAAERQLMEGWIQILKAFVNDDKVYKFGTTSMDQIKVMTPEGKVEIRSDERWEELVKLGGIIAGN